MLRRCIIIGTTNTHECLPYDETGMRRFVPILLNKGTCVEKFCEKDRDSWWAEALFYVEHKRKTANLPRNLYEEREKLLFLLNNEYSGTALKEAEKRLKRAKKGGKRVKKVV